MKRLFKLIILSLLSLTSAYASYELEALVHTQKNKSIKDHLVEVNEIEEIKAEELENNNNSSIDDVLTLSPAATTARGPRSSGEAPQVRGLDTGKIFVLVDGVRQNFKAGHNSMIAVDIENLKKVEVFKNASDLSKGGSLGGGVQFITKDPEDYLKKNKQFGSSFKAQHNGANEETSVNAKVVHKGKRISKLFSLTSTSSSDLELNDGSVLQNSSYKDINLLTKLKFNNYKFTYENFTRKE